MSDTLLRRTTLLLLSSSAACRAFTTTTQPASISSLVTPNVILDRRRCEANIKRMLERSQTLGTVLRPHVKTHKTVEGALMQTGGRRSTITCSTLAEAEFFAAAGFTDIVYAVPIDPFKIRRVALIAEHVHVTVDNIQQVATLTHHGPPGGRGTKWSVVVMVDCGYGRDGIDVNDPEVKHAHSRT